MRENKKLLTLVSVTFNSINFKVTPEQLHSVLHDLDRILEVACDKNVRCFKMRILESNFSFQIEDKPSVLRNNSELAKEEVWNF